MVSNSSTDHRGISHATPVRPHTSENNGHGETAKDMVIDGWNTNHSNVLGHTAEYESNTISGKDVLGDGNLYPLDDKEHESDGEIDVGWDPNDVGVNFDHVPHAPGAEAPAPKRRRRERHGQGVHQIGRAHV